MRKLLTSLISGIAATLVCGVASADDLNIAVKTETSGIDPHWQTLIVNIQIDRHFLRSYTCEREKVLALMQGLAGGI